MFKQNATDPRTNGTLVMSRSCPGLKHSNKNMDTSTLNSSKQGILWKTMQHLLYNNAHPGSNP